MFRQPCLYVHLRTSYHIIYYFFIFIFQVRLAALKVMQELNHKLGEEYLTLLPEIIPFLAELMEGKYLFKAKDNNIAWKYIFFPYCDSNFIFA